jgi:hypothetical protein
LPKWYWTAQLFVWTAASPISLKGAASILGVPIIYATDRSIVKRVVREAVGNDDREVHHLR